MQMKGVSKVQFGKLNDKRFYFSNEIISLPYGHPSLESMRKEKQKNRLIHKKRQEKKEWIFFDSSFQWIFKRRIESIKW